MVGMRVDEGVVEGRAGVWGLGVGPVARLQTGTQLVTVNLGQLNDRGPLQSAREDPLVELQAEAGGDQRQLGGDSTLHRAERDRVPFGATSAPEVYEAAAHGVVNAHEAKKVPHPWYFVAPQVVQKRSDKRRGSSGKMEKKQQCILCSSLTG